MASATASANPSMTLDPKYDHYDYPTTSPEAKSGHPGHTTKEQDAQVHQLRMALEQADFHERLDTLTFIDCENWRKQFEVDKLLREFKYEEKPQVFEYYPQYYHKTDKDGRPVYIEQLGKIDLTAMYKITTAERMLQNLVCEYEKVADPRLPACSRKAGRLLETCCTIMDLKGVGITNISSVYGYVKQAAAISQNYYPERLGRMYLINAPWGFAGAFSMIKGFLDPVTVDKIRVLGSGYAPELLQQIPRENLPRAFGGACDCAGGCALSDVGPWQDPQWARRPWWAPAAEGEAKERSEKEAEAEAEGESAVRPTKTTEATTSSVDSATAADIAAAVKVVSIDDAAEHQTSPPPLPQQQPQHQHQSQHQHQQQQLKPTPTAPSAAQPADTPGLATGITRVGNSLAASTSPAAPVPGAAPAPF